MDEKEKELIRRSLDGETSAFEQLVLPYRNSIVHLAYRLTGNMDEAMDIAQETFLRCFQYLPRFNQGKIFRNWLFQIAVNLARSRMRKLSRERKYLSGIVSFDKLTQGGAKDHPCHQASAANGMFLSSEIRLDVNRVIGLLSPKERQVFVLRDLKGLSIKETASVLGTSSISVRVNLTAARKKIRKAILPPEGKVRPEG